TIIEFLEESAQTFGQRTALLFKPGIRYQKWSYAQLWEGAGKVATLLEQRGLKKGDRALLWAPNCPQWVLAFFGCIRAGVIAVPLDLRSPDDFVERVVSKSSPSLAFVSRLTPGGGEGLDMPLVRLEELEPLTNDLPAPQEPEVSSADIAEIMFTSGTTGDPKGVMLTHGNILADLEGVRQYIPGKPSYRLLSLLPLSHMFEQMGGLFQALACGASVTYPTSRQPAVLFRTMQETKVTTMLLVPQALDLFMSNIEREVRRQGKERLWNVLMVIARRTPFRMRRYLFRQVHRRFGGHLDLIVSGGAALAPELGEKWALLGVRLLQGYGATETSPVVTVHPIGKPRFDSVGLPLPGVDVRISGDGEVLVRGPIVMPGYWEAPEQTAAVLEEGWYKTGDLGEIDGKGYLHLKGRKKDMIVLASGQNVYPEDIEGVLMKAPGVTDAVVVGLPRDSGLEVHAALIMTDEASGAEAVSWADAQLAEQQRIHGFTVWPDGDFPRTHTLKVKKGVVIDILSGSATPTSASTPATSQTLSASARGLEALVAEIGGVALDQVTPDKTLGEDLNLDSLGRVELFSAIDEELGVYIDEGRFGPDSTLGELKELVESGVSSEKPTFPHWGRSWPVRMLRGVLQRSFLFPTLGLIYRLRVVDRERLNQLDGLKGPVLFASNHHLRMDHVLILKAIPSRVRRRLAIAAAADVWRHPPWFIVNPLLGNGFPFAREGAIRASLENTGRILDGGWSVLIYPEGKITIGGPFQPFLSGVGLLAIEARTPVVPIRVYVHSVGVPPRFPIVKRGDIEIRFGDPVHFPPDTSYAEATQMIEDAIKAL
ncbi:MAG: AMP-binding protein, partial [Dehalococcoidia bacterium]